MIHPSNTGHTRPPQLVIEPVKVLRVLRIRQICERTGLGRSTIYARLSCHSPYFDPEFPTAIRLGGTVGWIEAEIEEYIEGCIKKSRGGLS